MILAAAWIIVGEQISGVSSDAVVNARLGTVRAPIAGKLEMPFRAFGEEFAKGDKIADLIAVQSDTSRLDDLRVEESLAQADLDFIVATRDVKTTESETGALTVDIASTDEGAGLSELGPVDAIDADLQRAEIRLAAVRERIRRENIRIAESSQVALGVPIDGVLWEVRAGDGEYVERGQEIAKFMACGSALVTLSVPEHVYARLAVGQTAKFRLEGMAQVFDGTITRMAGAGAETIYQNLAVAPSIRHLERYDVALIVPDLRSDPRLRCAVGQSGRVFFDSRPLDWLRTALR
jgi:multidrug efflux pump subunit AcrA (membrane-fusion protein)